MIIILTYIINIRCEHINLKYRGLACMIIRLYSYYKYLKLKMLVGKEQPTPKALIVVIIVFL